MEMWYHLISSNHSKALSLVSSHSTRMVKSCLLKSPNLREKHSLKLSNSMIKTSLKMQEIKTPLPKLKPINKEQSRIQTLTKERRFKTFTRRKLMEHWSPLINTTRFKDQFSDLFLPPRRVNWLQTKFHFLKTKQKLK